MHIPSSYDYSHVSWTYVYFQISIINILIDI